MPGSVEYSIYMMPFFRQRYKQNRKKNEHHPKNHLQLAQTRSQVLEHLRRLVEFQQLVAELRRCALGLLELSGQLAHVGCHLDDLFLAVDIQFDVECNLTHFFSLKIYLVQNFFVYLQHESIYSHSSHRLGTHRDGHCQRCHIPLLARRFSLAADHRDGCLRRCHFPVIGLPYHLVCHCPWEGPGPEVWQITHPSLFPADLPHQFRKPFLLFLRAHGRRCLAFSPRMLPSPREGLGVGLPPRPCSVIC